MSHALRTGLIQATDLIELGTLLGSGQRARHNETMTTIADLTGVAVQDAQIAMAVMSAVPRFNDLLKECQ